ncbi:MAG TPA: ABC transporter substrate-binding protein [Candidatus Limiplasma sp.]|nr:ABC transporter substrate-binding protein [Candidatus Limiplasma sp.]
MKKVLSLVLSAALAATAFSGALAEKTTVTFWHSMGGAGGEAITKIVSDFNAANPDIEVVEQYQGSYDDAITKLKSAASSGQGPEIMQLYDIGTRWMIDSGYAVTMQDVMDRNGFDATQLEPNIAGYYTVDAKLYSMPFNSSTPLMYFNADLLTAAGLDPANPPKTMAELTTACEALTKGDVTGMSFRVYSWFFEQYCSKQGLAFADNDNGRSAAATSVAFDSDGAGLAFFNWINDMNQKGLNANFGRDDTATVNAFAAGKIGFIFGSTASLTSILKAVNGAFQLGTAPLPNLVDGVNGGVSIGGGSLWMMNKGDDATKDAAWKFIQYAVSPEVQVYWHEQTGYFPVTVKAYDLDEMKTHLEKNPLFKTAIDQLHASPVEAHGALLGVFTEARGIIESNWENLLGGTMTPEQVVSESASAINDAIAMYNDANQ